MSLHKNCGLLDTLYAHLSSIYSVCFCLQSSAKKKLQKKDKKQSLFRVITLLCITLQEDSGSYFALICNDFFKTLSGTSDKIFLQL